MEPDVPRLVGPRRFLMELTLWLGHNYSEGTRVWTRHGDGVIVSPKVFYGPQPYINVRLDDGGSEIGYYLRELIPRHKET